LRQAAGHHAGAAHGHQDGEPRKAPVSSQFSHIKSYRRLEDPHSTAVLEGYRLKWAGSTMEVTFCGEGAPD
jgi:hypothetical protein